MYCTRLGKCTDEILISDVNSYKSSLAIIYMCLKMYCHEYVANFNFISIHVAQVWLSNVPPCPSPLSQLLILIPLSHQAQEERLMCVWSDWP